MKKIVLVFSVAFLFVQVSRAELFQFGIKAGIGYSRLKIEDLNIHSGSDAWDLATGDGVVAYHVGVTTRIKIAMLYIQPELYFNDGGGSLTAIQTGGIEKVLNIDLKSLDLPIMLGAKFGPLRINVGPVGSYVFNDGSISLEMDGIEQDYTVFTNSMTWGFQAGLGVDLSKISLDTRYEGSLSKLGDSFTVGSTNFNLDARPSQWVFSLGFWF
jgi:hypothetical protein